jgi:hypothetical protein
LWLKGLEAIVAKRGLSIGVLIRWFKAIGTGELVGRKDKSTEA